MRLRDSEGIRDHTRNSRRNSDLRPIENRKSKFENPEFRSAFRNFQIRYPPVFSPHTHSTTSHRENNHEHESAPEEPTRLATRHSLLASSL